MTVSKPRIFPARCEWPQMVRWKQPVYRGAGLVARTAGVLLALYVFAHGDARPGLASGDSVLTVDIVVPATAIPPGGVISEDMLMMRRIRVRRPITGLYATRLDEAAGMVAKRTLRANRAIPVSMLRQPYLFKEGQRVELLFAHGALSIVASGVALEPGAAGRTVSVRNIDSGRVVRGEVANDGRVLVGGP
jgi:flagella basal body P-ring formation protein FlgA